MESVLPPTFGSTSHAPPIRHYGEKKSRKERERSPRIETVKETDGGSKMRSKKNTSATKLLPWQFLPVKGSCFSCLRLFRRRPLGSGGALTWWGGSCVPCIPLFRGLILVVRTRASPTSPKDPFDVLEKSRLALRFRLFFRRQCHSSCPAPVFAWWRHRFGWWVLLFFFLFLLGWLPVGPPHEPSAKEPVIPPERGGLPASAARRISSTLQGKGKKK